MVSENTEYKFMDLWKLVCAFLVIGIHTRPFMASSELLDRLFYYDIANYAVPFFYACTGFFLVIKHRERDIRDKLLLSTWKFIKVYVCWSALYLPLTIYGWFAEGGSGIKYVMQCLRNYIFVGENYYSWTLWYLNGLIFALLLIFALIRRVSIRKMIFLGTMLYTVGVILTALNEHIDKIPLTLASFVILYFKLFVTTRNGLFQSFVFILIGMRTAEKVSDGELLISRCAAVTAFAAYVVKVVLSLATGNCAIYISSILDLPIFAFLFTAMIYGCCNVKWKGCFYRRLGEISSKVYFVHMYFVALCALVLFKDDYHNFKSFAICSVASVLVALASSLAHRLQNNQPNNAELFSEGAECFRNSNSLHNGDRIYG